jgi:hypothetical protein
MTTNPPSEPRQIAPVSLRPRSRAGVACAYAIAIALVATLSLSCFDLGGFSTTGGRSGTGISQGHISSFGSIFVNGVEWNLDDATVELDGQPASEADLRVGMVVRIDGLRSDDGLTGEADHVVFDDSIEGPVANLQDAMFGFRDFDILGVLVTIEQGYTRFDEGASFADLDDDDVVEISGFIDEFGGVRATRVERVGRYPDVDEVELKGTISGLDLSNNSFWIGSVFVQYDENATEFDDLGSEDDLANGLFVEVEGSLLQRDELDATKIEREESGVGSGDVEEVHLEGLVTNFVSQTEFWVAGVRVDATSAAFEPSGFVVTAGARVELEGRLEGGILIADRVESEDDENGDEESVFIVGKVSAIDGAARTLELLGVSVRAHGETEIEDESSLNVSNFGFDDIRVGDWLEVRGAPDGMDAVLAKDIERDDEGNDLILQGPVTQVDNTPPPPQYGLSVLGIPIAIHAGTQYEEAGGAPLTESEFFDSSTGVMVDDEVRAVDEGALQIDVFGEADVVSFEVD